jgi:hypothetical protein
VFALGVDAFLPRELFGDEHCYTAGATLKPLSLII